MTDVANCATLPSSESATRLLDGDLSVVPLFVGHFLGRAAIIGSGLWIAGDRNPSTWFRHSVAGALGFEMFVLWHRALELPPTRDPNAAPACASLPSTETATHLLGGNVGAFASLTGDFASRMAIMAAALWVAGDRQTGDLLRHSAGGSLAVTMFGLWYRARTLHQANAALGAPAAPPAPSGKIEHLVPQRVPFVNGEPAYSPVHVPRA